jgi:hypothetical protein
MADSMRKNRPKNPGALLRLARSGDRTRLMEELQRNNDRPSYAERKPLPLAEVPADDVLAGAMINEFNSYLRIYKLGNCKVIITKDFGRWHLSISRQDRYPSWDEIAEARYRLTPRDVRMVLELPPIHEYVNIHSNCFQLIEVRETNNRPEI